MDRNLATMEHPVPAVSLEDETLASLAEDAATAGEAMDVVDGALAAAIALPALELALDAAVLLVAVNVVADAASIPLPPALRLPVWLNMSGFSRVGTKTIARTCEELEADVRTGCPAADSAPCGADDSCEELLTKRKSLVACAYAWQALSTQGCGAAESRASEMKANKKSVKRCGDLISNNDRCCPKEVTDLKDSACPHDLPGCAAEGRMPDAALTAAHCVGAKDKLKGAKACRDARTLEKTRCFGGLDEPGHAKALDDIGLMMETCVDVIGRATRLNLCP